MSRILLVSAFFTKFENSRPFMVYTALKNKYDVKIICSDFDHSSRKKIIFTDDYIEQVHVPKYYGTFSIKRILSHIVFAFKSLRYVKRSTYDLVYILMPPNLSSFFISSYLKKKSIPCIIDVVDIWPNYGTNIFYKFWSSIRNNSLLRANRVILETNYYRNYIPSTLSNVNVLLLCKKSDLLSLDILKGDYENSCNIMYLGAFSPSYNFDGLVLFAKHISKFKKTYIHIIGDGPLKDKFLSDLIVNKIEFIDYGCIFNEEEKSKILLKCHYGYNGVKQDVKVGLSYKSIDYFSCGLPILNSVPSDSFDIVAKENVGFNFSDDNIKDIAYKVALLDYDSYSVIRNNVKKVYIDYFCFETYRTKLLDIVGDVIKYEK